MSDRSDDFDPYEEWLEIPPEEQPPSYYRLLGVEEFEEDLAVIDAAAKKRTAYLHPMGSGPERESVHRLLGEVAKARRTLLSEESKRNYDEHLLQLNQSADSESEADAESVVDDAGDTSPTASFQIDTGTESSGRPVSGQPSKQKERAQKATRSSQSHKQASVRNKTDRIRKKQWANDWRVHAASIVTLLTVVTGFVLYTNTRSNRRAAAPIASAPESSRPASTANGQNSAQAGRQKPNRRVNQQASAARQSRLNRGNSAAARQRASGLNVGGTGKSQLALALEAQMAKSADAAGSAKPKSGTGSNAIGEDAKTDSGKPNSNSVNPNSENAKGNPEKANPGKGSKGKAPTSVRMDLGGDWFEALTSIAGDGKFSAEQFEAPKGTPAMKFEDGRLVLQPVSGTTKSGNLIAKNVKVKMGELAALETNLRKGLPEGARVGLIVGPIRVRLDSKKNNLEIRMHGQKLGAFAPQASDVVRLAVVREKENPKRFRWLIQAGEKAIAGRAELEQDVAAELPVGLLFWGPKNAPGKPVWVRGLGVGSLSELPEFKPSKLLSIPAPK